MKMKNATLVASIAGVLGLSSPFANAAVNLTNGDTAVVFSAEAPDEGVVYYSLGTVGSPYSGLDGRLAIDIPLINGYKVTSTSELHIKIGLRGGARFGTAGGTQQDPVLYCKTAGTTNTFNTALGMRLTANAPGTTNVTFTFNNTDVGSSLSTGCRLVLSAAGGAAISANYIVPGGSDFGPVVMSALYQFQDGISPRESAIVGTIITFDTAAVGAVATTNGNTAANAVINVQDASQSFTEESRVGEFEAYLGTYSCNTNNTNANSSTLKYSAAAQVAVSDIYTAFDITLNGPGIAGASEITVNSRTTSPEVCKGAVLQTEEPDGATTVTFTALIPSEVSAGVDFCLKVDGNVAVAEGQITVDVLPSMQSNWTDQGCTVTQGNLLELTKNGATVRVLNITGSSAQDKTFIRLYNAGAIAGSVLGSLYSQDGTQIGTTTEIANLEPNTAEILTSAAIEQLFGTFTGRAYMVIDGSLSDLRVLATLRARSGVLVNMSGEAQ